MKVSTSSDVAGGANSISEPGTYHCSVLRCEEGKGPNGGIIDGLTAALITHAGTAPDQERRTFNLTLFLPNYSKSESSQDWAKKKLTALALACDLISPAELGKEDLDIDFTQAKGRQLLIRLERQKDENGQPGKYLDLAYSDIFHVDDPRVADMPKEAKVLEFCDSKCRHDAQWFEAALKKRSDQVNVDVL